MSYDDKPAFDINDSYSPYTSIQKKEEYTLFNIDVPSKYKIELKADNILPGISIVLNKANLIQRYTTNHPIPTYTNPEGTLIISYLVSGEGQIAVDDDKFIPMKAGDINIHLNPHNNSYYSYYGENILVHIIINSNIIKKYERSYTTEYVHILKQLFKKTDDEEIIIMKSEHNLQKILDEMKKYDTSNKEVRRVYHQIKIIEMIIYLYELNLTNYNDNYKTYTDAQIRVVRKIKNQLSRDIASYKSLELLAKSYGINLTTLKNCFRDMYGKPLYTWYREYKFHRATELIKNTNYPISKIAHMIGYKSSSKFTKAFKKEMGVLPSSYRKKKN